MTLGKFLLKHKLIILYGLSLGALVVLLKWLEFRFVVIDHSFEIYVAAIALIFMLLGIWLSRKLSRPKIEKVIVEKEVYVSRPEAGFIPDDNALATIGITKREWEVLALMSEGLSNQEIAEKLFLSLNTIKTHSSRLFEKLEVKRRTQAIEKAKRLGILA